MNKSDQVCLKLTAYKSAGIENASSIINFIEERSASIEITTWVIAEEADEVLNDLIQTSEQRYQAFLECSEMLKKANMKIAALEEQIRYMPDNVDSLKRTNKWLNEKLDNSSFAITSLVKYIMEKNDIPALRAVIPYDEVVSLWSRGRKVDAIKLVKTKTNLGLSEAKDLTEWINKDSLSKK